MTKALFFIASIWVFLACKKEDITTAITPTNAPFTFKSTAFTDNGTFPKEYTCDGASTSPPSMDILLTAIKSTTLGTQTLTVTYTRP